MAISPAPFTGASKNGYIGKIREADGGGVMFLDGLAIRLLQTRLPVLQVKRKELRRSGARERPVSFALICATHRNLMQHVADGTFLRGLLYRLR